ncbi:MAG: TIR domain-containing protein [Verrucomicrobia bacterium]|nr:TIR domain-containing protein [Verrucomicrobiota bacterium]
MPDAPSQPAVALSAVFVSYASQDAAAAQRLCAALQAAGVEVWLDQSELAGGDTWDRKIREQIKACALFAPIISASTQARREGYFRLEWKLAAQRTHTIADGTPFLLPIVIDATRDADALVPEEFRAVQWTRLPDGAPTPQFVERVRKLLTPVVGPVADRAPDQRSGLQPSPAAGRRVPVAAWVGALAVIAIGLGATFFATQKSEPPSPTASASTRPPTASAKSLAVLPFANLSTEKENEFFADGMHDELLTALAKVGALKVISRTSVLAYRDPAKRGLTLKQIAAELGVANILEGTVSRAAGSVRIKVKLIDAATDQPRWEDTINLKAVTDVFQAQADISARIAQSLAATISPELKLALAKKLTDNPAAYDLYLRARRWREMNLGISDPAKYEEIVVTPLEQAVALDRNFAVAYAELSQVHSYLYWWPRLDPTPARLEKAKAAVDEALRLDPALPVAHSALGYYHYVGSLDYARAAAECAIALAGMPGDADILLNLGAAQRRQGRWAEATVNLERAFGVNPRSPLISSTWVECLLAQRYYARAERAAERALAADPASGRLQFLEAQARFARDGDRVPYRSALATIPSGTMGLESSDPRIRQFEEAIEDGRLAEAVRVGYVEPEQRGSRTSERNMHRYFFALKAVGEGEQARALALAAIARTTAETTDNRREWQRVARLAMLNAHAGQPDEARRHAARALELMPVKRDATEGPNALSRVAQVHLALGDRDRALALLDQALSVPSSLIANELRLEPWWAPLRDDPRFQAALAKATPQD